jgi:hypothetical protein
MNLRDYFAAKAMQSGFGAVFGAVLSVSANAKADDFVKVITDLCKLCYLMADAMLAARKADLTEPPKSG